MYVRSHLLRQTDPESSLRLIRWLPLYALTDEKRSRSTYDNKIMSRLLRHKERSYFHWQWVMSDANILKKIKNVERCFSSHDFIRTDSRIQIRLVCRWNKIALTYYKIFPILYRISNRPVISALLQKRPVTARSHRRTRTQEGTAWILFLHSAEVRDTHESGLSVPD